jgi:hypothetical protein
MGDGAAKAEEASDEWIEVDRIDVARHGLVARTDISRDAPDSGGRGGRPLTLPFAAGGGALSDVPPADLYLDGDSPGPPLVFICIPTGVSVDTPKLQSPPAGPPAQMTEPDTVLIHQLPVPGRHMPRSTAPSPL